MTSIFSFCLLCASCLCLTFWGMRKPERIYQYPFLVAAIFIAFLMPQAFSLTQNLGVVSAASVESMLIVCCLCLWMSLLFYRIRPNPKIIKRLNRPSDDKKLFQAGMAFACISFASSLLLSRISITTNVYGNWTGPATILYFFGNLRYIALAIFLNSFLRKPSIQRFFWVMVGLVPTLETVLLYGRRTPTFTLLALVGLSLLFVKRVTPPRFLVVIFIFLAAFLIPVIGTQRGDFWNAFLSGTLEPSSILEGLDRILLKGDVLELRNGTMLLEAADKLKKFGLGSGLWNDIVFQYVPGQLVGYDLKQSLQANWGVSSEDLLQVFGIVFSPGSTKTGVGESYAEFGYLGCLVFGAIAYLYRHVWIAAFYLDNKISQVLYAGLLSPAMVGVTHGIGRFLQDAIFQMVFVGLAAKYAQKRKELIHPRSTQVFSSSRV